MINTLFNAVILIRDTMVVHLKVPEASIVDIVVMQSMLLHGWFHLVVILLLEQSR